MDITKGYVDTEYLQAIGNFLSKLKARTYSDTKQYIVSEGLGVVTNMQLDVEFYPVETKIHWQLKESGLWITNVEVYNFLPDVVRWEDVHFSAPFMGNTIEVLESLGINDSTSVGLNFQPYTNVDTTMEIRMRADGSFPPNASVAIVMPSGAIPPAGCSILR